MGVEELANEELSWWVNSSGKCAIQSGHLYMELTFQPRNYTVLVVDFSLYSCTLTLNLPNSQVTALITENQCQFPVRLTMSGEINNISIYLFHT